MDRRDFIKYGTVFIGAGGACLLCKNYNWSAEKTKNGIDITDTRICKTPFTYCEIYDNKGDIKPSCPAYLKYDNSGHIIEEARFKNFCDNSEKDTIQNKEFNEFWNGKSITELRKRVLKGDFSMCRRDICTMYTPCTIDELPADYQNGPKEIKISYDTECNYNCLICRDIIKTNTSEEMELYDKVYLPKIINIAKNADTVIMLGSGEPLFSRHSRKLIKELVKAYPKIKFNLCTNGFFLDEKNLTELGIKNNVWGVAVPLDGINRETYKNIMRTDAFDRVMKNVELMAEWKKRGKINWMTINFVVQLMNYKELPEFVKLAQKLDVTAFISTYKPWGFTEFSKRYNDIAVFEPKNKHYQELVKILHNPVFKDKEHCSMEPRLFDIANS